METIDPFIDVGDSFSDMLAEKSPDQISIEVSEMTLTEHLMFTSETFNRVGVDLHGEGMEIAAGAAVFATTLARLFPNITKIHALEIVPRMVTKLQPKIIEATNTQNHVIPMIGDFNDIKVPDGSLDFVVGFNALHHSNDLKQTLREVSRILKPGGKLVFFDRAHPDHMTKAQEKFLLDREYGAQYKIDRGFDPAKKYNRADNGEHEPRFRDWNAAFAGTGLHIDTITTFHKKTFKRFLKVLASFIPYFIRARMKFAMYLIEDNTKLFLFYICPWLARRGKNKVFPLVTKFKTRASILAMKKMLFTATKK